MRVWIEKTKVKNNRERKTNGFNYGECIFSPEYGSDGRDTYRNMRDVQRGDVVLHFIDNQCVDAVSIVASDLQRLNVIPGYTDRSGVKYKLTKFQRLEIPVSRELFLNLDYSSLLLDISEESEVFYQKNLDLRQGAYLTPCPLRLYALINSNYMDLTGINLPHFNLIESNILPDNQSLNIYEKFQGYIAKLIQHYTAKTKNAGLNFDSTLIIRFISSLQAKPFVILSGLSGSGKTKLAESFAMYITESNEQWMMVPVGADWTNRDSLLGFENTITKTYSLPPYNVPEFIQRAGKEENKTKPYFLILDEMNLSVVERYFADFLSAMESTNKEISLHQMEEQENGKGRLPPTDLKLPPNLFIIGTVNVDESTYMFSPKVLDRANTIEFRLNETDVASFLKKDAAKLNLDELVGKGKDMAASFVQNCKKELDKDLIKKIDDFLIETFKPLKKAGAEFGYRTITEIRQLATQLNQFKIESDESRVDKDMAETIFDIAILQKLLPKLHGSVGKLKVPLTALAEICFDEGKWDVKYLNTENDERELSQHLRYPLSFEKIKSMYVRLVQNGFVSFAEA